MLQLLKHKFLYKQAGVLEKTKNQVIKKIIDTNLINKSSINLFS